MANKLTGCITTHGITTHERLPASVKEAAKAGDHQKAVDELKAHIAALGNIHKDVVAKHETNKSEFKARVVGQSSASQYVNRAETDPTNELNNFVVKSYSTVAKNIVQLTGSIKNALNALGIFKKNNITQEEQVVLNHFAAANGFGQRMGRTIENIFSAKEGSSFPHRYEDMLQYLPLRQASPFPKANLKLDPSTEKLGKLDAATRGAIAATAYEWLGLNGAMSLGQTEESLRMLLGLEKGEPLPNDSFDLLGDAGMNAEHLAKQLGNKILQRLSIAPGPQSDAMAKSRMEMSLGFMALAAMEDMGYVKRQNLIVDHTEDVLANPPAGGLTPIGLEAFKNGHEVSSLFYQEGSTKEGMKGMKIMHLIRLSTEQVIENNETKEAPIKEIRDIQSVLKPAPNAFDKLFANEPTQIGVNWEPPKVSNKIGDSQVPANKTHLANLKRYNSIPYQASQASLGFMTQLFEMTQGNTNPEIEKAFWAILGVPDSTHWLKAKQKNLDGIKRGLQREWQHVQDYLAAAAQRTAQGQSTDFYIPSDFMSNMRMLQRGTINPQNSKMHRNLFAPKEWTVSFDPAADRETDRAFHEAIAMAFDVESIKNGGPEGQRNKLNEKLELPVIKAALNALREYDRTGNLNEFDVQDIAAAVVKLGTKTHGLKGLIEYARYQNHTTGMFTTDIYTEIDGVSNGPIIGIMQMIPDSADKPTVLATLAMGGISTQKAPFNLDKMMFQNLLNDAYQRMGQEWALQLGLLRQELSLSTKGSDKLNLAAAKAIENILGPLVSHEKSIKGIVNKTVRTLSKPRTMQTIYGAGTPRQTALFTSGDLVYEGIYKKMESIIADVADQNPDVTEDSAAIVQNLQDFLTDLRALTDGVKGIEAYKTNGRLDVDKLKDFRITKSQIKKINYRVSQTYGAAMDKAIQTIYGRLIEARAPLNNTVQLAVTTYNVILKTKVDQRIAERLATGLSEQEAQITKEDLEVILKSIEHLIPKIKTPLHTASNPSYLPLAFPGKNRSYNKTAKVEQSYKGKVSVHRGYAEGIPYLENPGMGPMVTAIQMLDSMVANGLMGTDLHFLNNHDGFSHSILDSHKLRDHANEIFRKTMTEYDLGQAFADMHEELQSKGEQAMTALGVDPNDLLFGVKRNTESEVRTGGIFNDLRLDDELLEEIGLVRDKDESNDEFYQKALEDAKQRPDSFIRNYTGQMSRVVKDMAAQMAKNKKSVTDAVRHWAQYPHNGIGIVVENPINDTGKIFGKYSTNTVLKNDEKASSENQAIMSGLIDQEHASSPGEVSTNPDDYQNVSTKIDQLNASQVLDNIVNLDQAAGTSSVQNSTEHLTHLKRVVDSIVAKVMGPVELFMAEHKIDEETKGLYTINGHNNRKIWIQMQKRSTHPQPGMLGQGIRMSAAEVYVHELVHHITLFGLRTSSYHEKQASALYALAETEFTRKYGENAFRVFMNDPTADINDPANRFEVQAAKDRWNYVFNPKRQKDGKNNGTIEFVAFGLTNENFKRELSQLTINKEVVRLRQKLGNVFGKNIQTTLVNIFTLILDHVYNLFSTQTHSSRVDLELENLVRALSQNDGKIKNQIFQKAMQLEEAVTSLSVNVGDKKVKEWAMKAINSTKTGKKILTIRSNLNELYEHNNALSYNLRLLMNWYADQEQGLASSILTEMRGSTERLRRLHELMQRRKYIIDISKNEATKVMHQVSGDWWKRELSSQEKTAFTRGLLKTDISSLLSRINSQLPNGDEKTAAQIRIEVDAIIGYVKEPAQREARIQTLLAEISADPALKPFLDFFKNAADDLGYFMNTSGAHESYRVPFFNAHNIVSMKPTKHAGALQGAAFDKAVDLVDQLATLSALRYTREDYKRTAVQLMEEDWDAAENVLLHHNALKEDALNDLFHGNPALFTKGYVDQISNSRIQLAWGTLADAERFKDAGYVMQEKPLPRDPDDPVKDDIYIFKSSLGTVNDLQPGIASVTQNVARGEFAYDLQLQLGNSKQTAHDVGEKNNAIVVSHMLNKIDAMFKPRASSSAQETPKNYMVPKFDMNGNITAARYMMSEHTKDTLLEQFGEFDSVLGAMAATIVDKKYTPIINSELIVELKDMADLERKKWPEAYVEISPWSPHQRYRDIYHQLPPKTKAQILTTWGEHRMYVARDIVDLAFGYRKVSVTQAFDKDPRTRSLFARLTIEALEFALGWAGFNQTDDNMSKRGRVLTRAKAIEDLMIQTTKLGKSSIVVRNFGVVFGNHQSNTMYLKSKGMTLEQILKYNRQAAVGAIEYQKDKFDLDTIQARRDIIEKKPSLSQNDRQVQLKNIDKKIRELENRLAINPVTPFIEHGLLPTVVDDVETGNVQSPHVFGLEKAIDTGINMLPEPLQKVGKILFMTQDTQGYKLMNNAVKLTDFTARFALFHHYVAQGMDKGEAQTRVMDEFINFDLPTHRMLEYANRIGVVWFSKYQLRVLKHIKNLAIDHPFTSLTTYLLGKYIGDNNIFNSIPGVTKDLFQGFDNPFSQTISSVHDTVVIESVATIGETLTP